ncbi:hypothetical protein SDC9_203347 [bioreactor metagenome]|uniref:Uncharacterized protein n=1 Tax=bioreactor metagenome TaxID=1076179 RepID=A0A645J847_9ZZZZ
MIRQPVRAAAGAIHRNWIAGTLHHNGQVAHVQPEWKLREEGLELLHQRGHGARDVGNDRFHTRVCIVVGARALVNLVEFRLQPLDFELQRTDGIAWIQAVQVEADAALNLQSARVGVLLRCCLLIAQDRSVEVNFDLTDGVLQLVGAVGERSQVLIQARARTANVLKLAVQAR